jgi:HPt (histidine-containing phosphotransfer) domain-containing protein
VTELPPSLPALPTLPPVPTLSRIRLDSIAREVSAEFLDELVLLFVTDVAKKLDALTDAVRERRLEPALQSTHALKGAAASLGVLRLREMAARLEEHLRRNDWRAAETMHVRVLREFAYVRRVFGHAPEHDSDPDI